MRRGDDSFKWLMILYCVCAASAAVVFVVGFLTGAIHG